MTVTNLDFVWASKAYYSQSSCQLCYPCCMAFGIL